MSASTFESSFQSLDGLSFILEINKLKNILRQTLVQTNSRQENTAEHSWHLATAVFALHAHSNAPIQLEKAIKMALIHDIVELDAGDTFVYDTKGNLDKLEREKKAAERIFGLLPTQLSQELHSLWEEFEERQSAEARFVAGVDRFFPMMLNFHSEGHAWKKHGIKKSQVIELNKKMSQGSEKLWKVAQELIEEATRLGYLVNDSTKQ